MTCEVKILAHSINDNKEQAVTFSLRYWRAIHAELMTHRVLSRNASSSRAIPVKKVLAQVWNDPAGPVHWGSNQPGMQAKNELGGWRLTLAKRLWGFSGKVAVCLAWTMMKLGGHKQWVNRILEPWQYISVIVTATDWDNFFALRCHPDAQPEFHELATKMRDAIQTSTPRYLREGEWHIPLADWMGPGITNRSLINDAVMVSVARTARTSYNNHMGQKSSEAEDRALHDRLVFNDPPHMSPTEHQLTPTPGVRHANLQGWRSYRHMLERGEWEAYVSAGDPPQKILRVIK